MIYKKKCACRKIEVGSRRLEVGGWRSEKDGCKIFSTAQLWPAKWAQKYHDFRNTQQYTRNSLSAVTDKDLIRTPDRRGTWT